jgi:uncharacterized membrane protein YdjX (TVP38/TMEM64 family)
MHNPRILAVFVFVGSLAGAFALWQAGAVDLGPYAAAHWLQAFAARPAARWVLCAAVFLGSVIVFPVVPVIVFTGAVFGASAFAHTLAAMLAASAVCYTLGRYAGDTPRAHPGKTERIADFVRRHGAAASFFARFIPAFPFALQSTLLGAAGVPPGTYLLGTALAASVNVSVFLASGAVGARVFERVHEWVHFGWVLPAVGLAAAAILWRAGAPAPDKSQVTT